jgi:hypothetical protein
MLTVIVEAGNSSDRLPALLGCLTSAAVDGLVREVLIAGGGPPELLAVLREETGAELVASIAGAAVDARSDQILLLPAAIRLKPSWLATLGDHVRNGGGEAIILGVGGFLRPGPFGVLANQARVLAHPDLKRLRRNLGGRAARLA